MSWALAPVVVPFRATSALYVTTITVLRVRRPYDSAMDRTFFITSVTWQRQPIFRNESRAKLLLGIFFQYRDEKKYFLHEFVVMPDHLHVLITPAPEITLERAVQFIKGGFSYRLRKESKMMVWQQSFTNHRIRDAADYGQHVCYIHLNPVRARLAKSPGEYVYSSANDAFRLDGAPLGLKPGLRESA